MYLCTVTLSALSLTRLFISEAVTFDPNSIHEEQKNRSSGKTSFRKQRRQGIWTWASWGKTFASTSVNLTRWNGRFQLRSCSVPHTAIRTLLWCRFRGRYMHLARFTSSACGCVLVNKILLRTFSLAVWSHGIKLISHINNICKIWIMTKSWIIYIGDWFASICRMLPY